MRRRAFITLLGGAATWPLTARAQQPRVPIIGYLGSGSPEADADRLQAVLQGLSETGFVEGRNVRIEYRWMQTGHPDGIPTLAADLARRQVGVRTLANSASLSTIFRKSSVVSPTLFASKVAEATASNGVLSVRLCCVAKVCRCAGFRPPG
jgi:putative ABC transport system substrate-binding protein